MFLNWKEKKISSFMQMNLQKYNYGRNIQKIELLKTYM